VHIAGIARAFEGLGHQVDFSSPTGVDPRTTGGDDPFAGGGGTRSLWGCIARRCPNIVFELLELGYNVVSAVRNWRLLCRCSHDLIYERHAFFLCATAWVARRRRLPLVVEVNELVGDERVRRQPTFSGLAQRCDRFCFRHASLVTVVSPYLQRRVQAMGVPEERILVLPNAVAAKNYAAAADGVRMREEFGVGAAVLVGFVGWLVPWHRLEDLVRAVAKASSDVDIRLVIVGDGPLRGDLEALVQVEGIASRVHFVGAVPHHAVPEYIAAMDIAVIPHSNEYRSPIKLFEYMGQGKAVLVPQTEPIEMVVQHEHNGLLFDAGDAPSLGEGLARLLSDPALRERIGGKARVDVLAHHTWRRNAERILERLTELGVCPTTTAS